jgi:hypothetical protein
MKIRIRSIIYKIVKIFKLIKIDEEEISFYPESHKRYGRFGVSVYSDIWLREKNTNAERRESRLTI